MPTFFAKAKLCVTNREQGDASQPYGPIFTRWIPNGKADALIVALKNGTLRFWFERRGYMSSPGESFVEYDPDRNEVDESIIPRQGQLDGGHLHVELELADVKEDEIASLETKNLSDPKYVALLKRVISQIQRHLKSLLSLLRVNFGQYWIRVVGDVSFESARAIDRYCGSMNILWKVDQGKWATLATCGVIDGGETIFGGQENYVSKQDWEKLQELLQLPCEPTTTEMLLVSANRLLDLRELKHALIEGVTAIEIAIDEALRQIAGTPDDLIQQSFDKFRNLELPLRFIIVASQRKDLDQNAFRQTLEAIKLRNEVVHRGADVPNAPDNRNMIRNLLRVAAQIIGREGMRFPRIVGVAQCMFPHDSN